MNRIGFSLLAILLFSSAHAQSYVVSEYLSSPGNKSVSFYPSSDGGAIIYSWGSIDEVPGIPVIADFSAEPARKKEIRRQIFTTGWSAFALMDREPRNSSVLYWQDGPSSSIPVDPTLVKPKERSARKRSNVITVRFGRLTNENGLPKPFFVSARKFGSYSASLAFNGKIALALSRPRYTDRNSVLYQLGIDGSVEKLLEIKADNLSPAMTREGDVIAIASKSADTSTKVPSKTTLLVRRAGETSFTTTELSIDNKDIVYVADAVRNGGGSLRLLILTTLGGRKNALAVLREDGSLERIDAELEVASLVPGGGYVGGREGSTLTCGTSKSLGFIVEADGSRRTIKSAQDGSKKVCVSRILAKLPDGRLVAFVRTPEKRFRIGVAVLKPE